MASILPPAVLHEGRMTRVATARWPGFAAPGARGVRWLRHAPGHRGLPGLASNFGGKWLLTSQDREVHVTPPGAIQPFTWIVLRRQPGLCDAARQHLLGGPMPTRSRGVHGTEPQHAFQHCALVFTIGRDRS